MELQKTATDGKTTVIEANVTAFNPYFLQQDKKLQIDRMHFFNSETGTILFSTGWFNNGGSNNQTPKVTFPFSISKKREQDLTKNVAFYMPMVSKYSFDKGKIDLFIPIQLLPDFKEVKKVFRFETETAKHYQDEYSFNLLAIRKLYRLNEMEQLESYSGPEEVQEIKATGQYMQELKPFGEKVKEVTEKLNASGLDVSKYDIEKILTVYDMQLKAI